MTPSNATRAERAENALQAYIEARGEVFENSRSEIADLIADLLHLINRDHAPADESPASADEMIRSTLDLAQMHYEAERDDPEEDISWPTASPTVRDKLLDIKILAESGDDNGYEPYALLDLIAHEARAALALGDTTSADSSP